MLMLSSACKSHNGTLYLNRVQLPYVAGIGTNLIGVLSPKQQMKVVRYLERRQSTSILVIGKDRSIHSFKEYTEVMNAPFPNVMSTYSVFVGRAIDNMDYKDVWLSKGPPMSIFIMSEEAVTWRYKDDFLVVFFNGKVVRIMAGSV